MLAGVLGVLMVALATAYLLKLTRPEKSSFVPQRLPRSINQQLSGYTFTRSEGGRQIFTVHAARTVAMKEGGKTLLEEVTVEVFGRMGNRHDSLKTHQCEYEPQTGSLSCEGKVEIRLNAGGASASGPGLKGQHTLHLEASQVSYEPKESLVVSDAPVRFRYGPASGSAVGMRYDTAVGWMELKSDVLLNLPPFGGLTSPVRVAAAGLVFEKEKGQVQLHGPLEIVQGTRRVMAGRGTILVDQENRISGATLEGDVQGSDSSRDNALEVKTQAARAGFDVASSQLRTLVADGDVRAESRRGGSVAGGEMSLSRLSAQHLDVSFTSAGSKAAQPSAATASGNVKMSSQSRPALRAVAPGTTPQATDRASAQSNELTASQVQFEFYSRGRGLRQAKTIGPGELVVVPADPSQGKRIVTAGQLVIRLDEQNRLQSLRGLSAAKVVVEPAPQHPPAERQESSSDELEARFDPATQELATLEQSGDFHFRQGDRQAAADRAFYTAKDRLLTLTGGPRLWDAEARMQAQQFRINLASGTAEGSARVESTHFGRPISSASSAPPARAGARAQSGIESGDTINVLADRVIAARDSQSLRYEGHVRAWSGYDVVESPSLDIFRQQRRIVSGPGVVTSHMPPGPARSGSSILGSRAPDAPLGGGAPVTIRADRLEYLDEGREASYRGHVEVTTADAILRAEHVQAYFSLPSEVAGGREKGARLERVAASGHVTVTQPGRRASADHAEYLAGAGKIVMTGGPPSLYDERNGFTTGRSLTFHIGDDSLLVDGGEASPTLSKRHLTR